MHFQTKEIAPQENNVTLCANQPNNNECTRLMIVPVIVHNTEEGSSETTFALLDSASDQSFISSSLAVRLNLKTQAEISIIVNTFSGRVERKEVKRATTLLSNSQGEGINVELLASDKLTQALNLCEITPQDKLYIQERCLYGEDIWITSISNETVTPEILIGIDYFNAIMKLSEPVTRLPSGLFITPTLFGPVVSGVQRKEDESEIDNLNNNTFHTCGQQHQDIHDMDYSDLWKLPAIGTEDFHTEEELNKQIIDTFYSSVQMQDGKIFVQFPWKANKNQN